jgi:hypothetical protein
LCHSKHLPCCRRDISSQTSHLPEPQSTQGSSIPISHRGFGKSSSWTRPAPGQVNHPFSSRSRRQSLNPFSRPRHQFPVDRREWAKLAFGFPLNHLKATSAKGNCRFSPLCIHSGTLNTNHRSLCVPPPTLARTGLDSGPFSQQLLEFASKAAVLPTRTRCFHSTRERGRPRGEQKWFLSISVIPRLFSEFDAGLLFCTLRFGLVHEPLPVVLGRCQPHYSQQPPAAPIRKPLSLFADEYA